MGCEPDRASYNIMVDAYGRAGLHEGKMLEPNYIDVLYLSEWKKISSREFVNSLSM